MVNQTLSLDFIFGSLADATRRDILRRVAKEELSVGEIAKPYNLTLAAISKHLGVLERARLISKQRRGKEQIVQLAPQAFAETYEYLEFYRKHLEDRMNGLEQYLRK